MPSCAACCETCLISIVESELSAGSNSSSSNWGLQRFFLRASSHLIIPNRPSYNTRTFLHRRHHGERRPDRLQRPNVQEPIAVRERQLSDLAAGHRSHPHGDPNPKRRHRSILGSIFKNVLEITFSVF